MTADGLFLTTVRVRQARSTTLALANVSRTVGRELVEVTCYGRPVALVRPGTRRAKAQIVWQTELPRGSSQAILDTAEGAIRLMQLAHQAGFCVADAA